MDFDSLRKLVEAVRSRGLGIDIGTPTSEPTIHAVEKILGVSLPLEYREFLAAAGTLFYADAQFSGVYDDDVTETDRGSVVRDTQDFRDDPVFPEGHVVVYYDENVPYLLSCENGVVFSYDRSTGVLKKIFESFDDFLRYFVM